MRDIVLLLSMFLLPGLVVAQIDVKNSSLKKTKREVEVRFDFKTTKADLKSRYRMTLIPYLLHGTDTAWLSPVTVYGPIKYKRERQERFLVDRTRWTLEEGEMLRGDSMTYRVVIPYERWMRVASLQMDRKVDGCGCDCYDGSQEIVGETPIYIAPVPVVTETKDVPGKYEVKEAAKRWTFKEKEMKVIFQVGRTELQPDRYGNQKVLDEIMAGVEKLRGMEKYQFSGVEINGFASPEGGLELNTRLGQKRAERLQEYIQSQMPDLTSDDFILINGVENWDGLRRLVEASDMEYKEEVLRVLDIPLEQGRKRELMNLEGGKPYRYMLKTFYPELRNACYISLIYDELTGRGADAINAAVKLINEQKYDEALKMLKAWENDDRAYNAIGVCLMMQEREEEAIIWFEKAIKAGHAEAAKNLEQIK